MIKLDPIIAVKNVNASAEWYNQIFVLRRAHGGNDFAVLTAANDDIVLCLHKWGEHMHPSMSDQGIPSGNGLLLYFKTDNLDLVRRNVSDMNCKVEQEITLNENSLRKEFSIRDPDGYFLTITEYHRYQ